MDWWTMNGSKHQDSTKNTSCFGGSIYIYIYMIIHASWIQWENNQHSTTRLFDWGIKCEFTEKTVTASNNSCSPSNMVMTSFSRFAAGFKGGSVSSTGCSRASMSRLKKICLKGSRKMILSESWSHTALDENHSGPLKLGENKRITTTSE